MSMAPTTDPKIQLLAGVAAVDITGTATEQIADPLYAAIDAEITNDRLCVKALVLRDEITSVVVITVDDLRVQLVAGVLQLVGCLGADFVGIIIEAGQKQSDELCAIHGTVGPESQQPRMRLAHNAHTN